MVLIFCKHQNQEIPRVQILVVSQIISRQDNLIMGSVLSQCQNLCQNLILAMKVRLSPWDNI